MTLKIKNKRGNYILGCHLWNTNKQSDITFKLNCTFPFIHIFTLFELHFVLVFKLCSENHIILHQQNDL